MDILLKELSRWAISSRRRSSTVTQRFHSPINGEGGTGAFATANDLGDALGT